MDCLLLARRRLLCSLIVLGVVYLRRVDVIRAIYRTARHQLSLVALLSHDPLLDLVRELQPM